MSGEDSKLEKLVEYMAGAYGQEEEAGGGLPRNF
jgi:hypothetical protein